MVELYDGDACMLFIQNNTLVLRTQTLRRLNGFLVYNIYRAIKIVG